MSLSNLIQQSGIGGPPTCTCMVCGKQAKALMENWEHPTVFSPPDGWHWIEDGEWVEEGYCCGCIPEGWGKHCSGWWIKPGFAHIEQGNDGQWLTPVGVYGDLVVAINACEERADEVRSFKGVL